MQKKFPIHKRSHPVRLAALVLALITAFGLMEMGRHGDTRRVEAAVPSIVFSTVLEKENETTRMPVRFDDGLRNVTISGL